MLFVINMWGCMGTRTWYADHVAGYPINMHWEKKAQTPARQPRCSKIEIEIENTQTQTNATTIKIENLLNITYMKCSFI